MIKVKPVFVGPVRYLNALGVPNLSAAHIEYLATRGNWLINAELRQAPIDRELGNGDCSVLAGQGVPDLDTAQRLMDRYPWGRFAVDVGGPNSFAEYIYIGTNDVIAWRKAYIAHWGTESRPQYWANDKQTIPINVPPGTAWP